MSEFHGHVTLKDGSHVPLSKAEAKELFDACDRAKRERAEKMPDEKSALRALQEAFTRLRELGWSEAVYCPKDGSHFQAIEAGSTGIHDCSYFGEWPNGSWHLYDETDIWPSRPILYRLYPEDEAKRKAKMAEAAAKFAAERNAE